MKMMNEKIISLVLVGVFCSTFCSAVVLAQESPWEKYTTDGHNAYGKGRHVEAERLYLDALKEAEKFGDVDTRFSISLNNLAEFYLDQAEYALCPATSVTGATPVSPLVPHS